MTKTEIHVNLNVHELGVILSALQLLDSGDEYQIGRYYGSSQAIYDRLKKVYDSMDHSTLYQINDCEPSF